MLDVGPVASGELALHGFVEAALIVIGPKAIAEGQHPIDLG